MSLPDARTNDEARGGERGEGESRDLQDGRYDTEGVNRGGLKSRPKATKTRRKTLRDGIRAELYCA